MHRYFPQRLFGVGAVFLLLAVGWCADATGKTWTGTGADSNVTTAANWSPSGQPGSNADAFFGPTADETPFFNFAGGARDRLGDVTFQSAAPTYTIQGDGTKSLQLRNIYNDSGVRQIFEVDLIFLNKTSVLAGAPIEFRGTIDAHTGNNELEFTGSSAIVLTGDNQVDSNLSLTLSGDVTLDLSGTTQAFKSLTVTGDAIIDFGHDASLSLNYITVEDGATLNVVNWSDDTAFFVAFEPDQTTLSSTYIDGIEARWDFNDGQGITPVPEPRVYGAIFMALAFALLYLKRRRRSRTMLIEGIRLPMAATDGGMEQVDSQHSTT